MRDIKESISTEISSRFWNLPQKADEEVTREQVFIDDLISKSHIERLLLDNLDGIRTVFDGGAGYGRFSLLLAQRGIRVTHFDISLPMIEKAKYLAAERGVSENMTFIHGSIEDLSEFNDGQFDLVMSFDAPISYAYPNHESAIKNLIRIASKKICFGVYSRIGQTPYFFDPAQKEQYILNIDDSKNYNLMTGFAESESKNVPDNAAKLRAGFLPDIISASRFYYGEDSAEMVESTAKDFNNGGVPWPISYAFMPDELCGLLERFGAKNVKLSGPGAFSRSVPGAVLRNIIRNEKLKREFLKFCYEYDSNPYVAGMGKDNIVATADVS
ncbi:MAG: class I SAM-dependent methyltransferase [Oscillospiraceae bacterium]|nr:class I SAM-dependent methyltransferase [Oscillospiraceae bacterium]